MTRAELMRLEEDGNRTRNWKRWGPYLAERQWATVREDYSATGDCWADFPHEHAPSRAYRWGEDGILGITDRQCRLCFAVALWNGRDPLLKERLFGLAGPEGNHGEDVKEDYFYLDSTPTHSYMKGLYKYPQREFPYRRLREENRRRSRLEQELDLVDTGVFDDDRYFDVFVEYAKASPDDILVVVTVVNRGPDTAPLHLLPTLWFRNTWSWGRSGEGHWPRPEIRRVGPHSVVAEHASLGKLRLDLDPPEDLPPGAVAALFTDNESNTQALWHSPNATPYVKDAFHRAVVRGEAGAVNPHETGTKSAFHLRFEVPPHSAVSVRLRLYPADDPPAHVFGDAFARIVHQRVAEADEFYDHKAPPKLSDEERRVARQAYAGLLWSKQFYHYIVGDWLDGDPASPPPPGARKQGRNARWRHMYCRDVISMPDKWEYPWYAAWDLAFHMVPFARIDPQFAKEQLLLLLREWYMHPNGQLPAYEFNFGDVNPPVHAWAAWRVYKLSAVKGKRDRVFLARVFQKLLINFTWWVNRKDDDGNNLFSGGFLGLDNVGVFDRSKPLPTGGHLAQADGTAWMAFYCSTMLTIALELAREDPSYEDLASKFFEHFVSITDAMNTLGGSGLWDEGDGFYYDQLQLDGGPSIALKVRSMVGIIPLFGAALIEDELVAQLEGFQRRTKWFLENRPDLARHISYMATSEAKHHRGVRLLAIPSKERLARVLRYVLDEREFLSPYGVRSLSRVHLEDPYVFRVGREEFRVTYVPGESDTGLFGGNSNWRGPIWFPVNYLLVEVLQRYHGFYGDTFKVECPTGSGRWMHLGEVAREIGRRLSQIFIPDASGQRPCNGDNRRYADDAHWNDLVLFHEYFDGDSGRGCGATHQTGWTALVARLLEEIASGGL